ncbi:DUF5304 family protein [Streptomyces melanogenes]|uniref:DUF5304 domain-containing protein n=1 Tax=Streptomyces melanogenes TaxID=67326 RepID=A0ABZ1XJ48_9ACTN|nr:DUF5304 family protein [Streptomyces melanogenes]
MSEATERPAPDADAWADACAEDLAAEKERRRAAYGPPPGSAAEELRKLVDAVADKVASFQSSLPGMAAQSAVQQLIGQAKAVVEPVIERNPQVFDHLAAAGGELLAAYRSAVEGHERRWASGEPSGTARGGSSGGPADGSAGGPPGGPKKGDGGAGAGPTEHIDLD